MFGINHYEVFLLSGILLNIIPGPDTLYILGRSISQGAKAGVLSALGISTGTLIHTMLAAFGLSAILAQSAEAFNAVKYAGAAYLIYLGLKSLLSHDHSPLTPQASAPDTMRKIYTQAVLTNLFNPKVALFFLAFLPQFISPGNGFGPLPFVLLGVTFITTGTLWCLMLALSSARMTEKLRGNQRISLWLNKLSGALFVGLGLSMLRARAE